MIGRAFPKTDTGLRAVPAKIEIRRRVLEAITPARAMVFDAFAGTGQMWAEVWQHAAGYVGCDERWHKDARCCFVADNRRVLRCLNLQPFTIFDLDAYGSPWEQALILAARRRLAPRERLGLVLTEGTWTKTRMGNGWPGALRQAVGIAPHVAAVQHGLTQTMHDDLIHRAVRAIARQMQGQLVRQWRAIGMTGTRMRYLGLILEGIKRPGAALDAGGSFQLDRAGDQPPQKPSPWTHHGPRNQRQARP